MTKTRTSNSHPLQIASITADPGMGRIGVTFCPGKTQISAMSGIWSRDLALDLDAIRDWGAAVVVTLIEDHEFAALMVEGLGAAVRARHMGWMHLPIRDVAVPDARFERAWESAGAALRGLLRRGQDVLVQCKGGLGRAGTVTARLLVELGWDAEVAIQTVRAVRPGAIETGAQERHVRDARPMGNEEPSRAPIAMADRARGALLGLAIGDALGTTLEFKARDTYAPLTDIVGGGPFGLKPGEWTDDTAMALALAFSLEECNRLDEADLMRRFIEWWRDGAYSCTGSCFDIGVTTSRALSRFERSGNPVAGDTSPTSAGNGSLMRLAPVAIRFAHDRRALADAAARQSRTTHAAPEAVEACVAYSAMLADAIMGMPLDLVLDRREEALGDRIGAIVEGSWRGKTRREIHASGYVAHSLEAALWSVARSTCFADAVLTAANLGEDADTTAAIAGQLAGAVWGESGIPAEWLDKLAWRGRIGAVAGRLWEAGQVEA